MGIRARPSLAAVLLGTALAAAAGDAPVSYQSIPLEGLALPHPCTYEPVDFHGALRLTTRSDADAAGVTLTQHVDAAEASAVGRASGRVFSSPSAFDLSVRLGRPPASTSVLVSPRFLGGGSPADFTAHLTLRLSVEADGRVEAARTGAVLTCG
ncbi:MAG: hypothetical protein KGL53_05365 [Elusimicrobia bacterium]|nr:hypothetical protein [Elusimicrobiota bacterium]